MTLRDYQRDILDRVREAYASGKRAPLVQLATGLGKTRIAVEACFNHEARGGSCLFVASRLELLDQAERALKARGCIMGVKTRVASIQELVRPRALMPPATLVVYDEARHYVAEQWGLLRAKLPGALSLGLDATPERGDGFGLGGLFDALIQGPSIADSVAAGWLVPSSTLRPDRALETRELAMHPVDAIVQNAGSRSTVLFAPTIDLAREWSGMLSDRGVPSAAIWGDMPRETRSMALGAYDAGHVRVLVNVQLLTEGWDSPRTGCVVLARTFGTAGGLLQAVGRGLRPWPGKSDLLLLDLVGATHTHGDIEEARAWFLSGKAVRRAEESEDVRFCPVCGAPSPAGEDCAQCGYTGPDMRKRKPRVLGLPIDRFARKRAEAPDARAKTLARWLREASSRGYRPGWAYARFKSVYGIAVSADVKRDANRAMR